MAVVAAQPVVLAQGEELPRRHQPAVVLPAQVRGQLLPVPVPELPRVEAQAPVWLLVAARAQGRAQALLITITKNAATKKSGGAKPLAAHPNCRLLVCLAQASGGCFWSDRV